MSVRFALIWHSFLTSFDLIFSDLVLLMEFLCWFQVICTKRLIMERKDEIKWNQGKKRQNGAKNEEKGTGSKIFIAIAWTVSRDRDVLRHLFITIARTCRDREEEKHRASWSRGTVAAIAMYKWSDAWAKLEIHVLIQNSHSKAAELGIRDYLLYYSFIIKQYIILRIA